MGKNKRKNPFFRMKMYVVNEENVEQMADKLGQTHDNMRTALEDAEKNGLVIHVTEYHDRFILDLKRKD